MHGSLPGQGYGQGSRVWSIVLGRSDGVFGQTIACSGRAWGRWYEADVDLNDLADTMVFCGCALVLASALSNENRVREVLPERAWAKQAMGGHQGGGA
jgi:hypothetical protein